MFGVVPGSSGEFGGGMWATCLCHCGICLVISREDMLTVRSLDCLVYRGIMDQLIIQSLELRYNIKSVVLAKTLNATIDIKNRSNFTCAAWRK